MRFRPCIDIHNGRVKQIVGSTLRDAGDEAKENFVSEKDAAFYAALYRDSGLPGGHVILLNPTSSPYYEETRRQAFLALKEYPDGLQVGGGVYPGNACEYLDAGASHVIVTSYVFADGRVSFGNLEKMRQTVGKEHLVLDLSCRKKDGKYYIVTNRWQRFTDTCISREILLRLGEECSEFLVHAVDVEGKASGVLVDLVEFLAEHSPVPVTYAGGIGSGKDLEDLRAYGKNRIDFTVGSALDIFGGTLPFRLFQNDQKSVKF